MLASNISFSDWTTLNDTIMGGLSNSSCETTSDGLIFSGNLVEKGGGFISCRSPLFCPPLNFSRCQGFKLEIDGDGRTLKLAVSCQFSNPIISTLISGRLKWVASIPTENTGTSAIQIPFSHLEPAIRAKSVSLPVEFQPSYITRIQLLHSKFGQPGQLNSGFRCGAFRILLRSISTYA